MKPSNTIALHRIDVPSPCTASWDKMKGDDRVRHCSDCNKNVFNLSAMAAAEATTLLADNQNGDLCVRFYRRPDGTVMTSDCSTSTRAFARRTLRKLPAMAGATVLALSAASAGAGQADPAPPKVVPVLGAVIPPAPPASVEPILTMGEVKVQQLPSMELGRVIHRPAPEKKQKERVKEKAPSK